MFEKFTEKAIKAIMLAQEEGRRLGHNFVGTEQILLGLIGEGTGVAAKVLKSMGVKLKGARLEVEKIIGRGSGDVEAEIPFTPRAKRVLELSLEEAQQLEHSYVGTEHLLLGLIREGEGVAVRVLENLGVDLSKVPTLINEMLLETVEVEVDISQKSEKTFERFTEKAIKAIMLAQEEARRLGHNCVGPEKILLGLIGEGTGVAAKVLKSMGVNLKDTRLEVEQIIGRGSGDVEAEIPFTPRAERVLEFSLEEAQQLGHNYIGTEHLLLGLIREGSGLEEGVLGNLESKAVRVLENLEVDLSKVPTLINEMLLKTVEVEVDISQKSEKTFERFTEKAIKAIMLAQEETRRLKHNFLGTEQILLGLIGEGTGVAAQVLKSMGVKLKDARLEVEQIIGRGSGFTPAEIPFTPRFKRVLEFSLEEARQLGHNYIGTEHLLLGLIRDRRKEAVAARVLENLGVDISKVRTQVIQMLGEIAEVEENISQDDSNTPQDDSNTPQDNNTNTLLFDDIEKLKAFIKDNIKEELKTISENNKINNYSQHIAKKFNENQPQFSFDDIGGAAQAKEELKTIIEFIRNPEYFQSLGARMPKGIILEGLPGTGKTLLAKAVASESNAHFFYMSASEFVELYVGVGASRVRDLFNEAKKNQPAIIYIDELDAVGQHRNSSSGENEERNNTLNQLLTELDGFESCQRIFVMASTNRGDMLDAALVRPGRFDKRIVVDLPSFAERCQILEIHLQNKKIAEDVNIEDIARYTIDFSGAELANIVNQAAILAAKNKCDSINQHLLEETTKAQGAIVPSAINVQQLKQDISKEIVGQNAALTAIAWSVCSHYANIFSRSESGVSYGNKPNLFLYGPPGSGKTAIIKSTAKTLEVPFVEMTASGLVKEQAYVQKILNRLLREANDDIRRAECGMVCLYGMEEITFDDFKFVQEELARVIEGEKFDAVGESFTKKNRLIDTQNILFVCELTLDGKSRSKNSVSRQKYEGTGQNATDDEILGDLGLVRRLINQFPMIVSTEVLKQEELLEVLTRGDDSPVSLFERCCQDLGIQVELEQSALDVVTRECFQQGGDARLLKRLLNKFLREDQGDWVSQKTVTVNGLMAEKALNQRIALKKNLNSNNGQKNIVTISEEVEKNIVTISEEVEKKVSEQEFAIAAYEQALLERTQTDFPIEWAAIQNDLGNAYWQRIRGDKAENIEMAIAAFEQALLVYTQTDFPMEWAKTQNNLGATYSDRIRGDKAQNLEAAIAACQQALLVQTQTDFPMDWAMTQNNLGIAYNNRIRGDKAENIEMAIAAYEQALLVYTQTDFPTDWARTQNNLDGAYIMLGEIAEVEEDISQKSEKIFERFTETAIKVILLAQEEARRLGHNFVGTEQILLGLIGEGTGVAAQVLKSMGIKLKDARLEVEKIIGRGSGDVAVEIPFTPRAKKVLELSLEEARQLGHSYVGTEHLLLGLIREGEGVAVRVLKNLGVDLSKVRTQVIQMLDEIAEVEEDISQKSEKIFERFTEKAIKAIMLAQEETRRLKHNFLGTEQILLGLIGEGTGVAAKVLKSMGVKLKDARLEVEKIIGRGSGFTPAEIPFTPRFKRVLEFSLEEAQQLEHSYIGTEHLLLGLIGEGEGVAARVLENLGVDISKVRTQVIQMLGEIAEVEEDISQDDSNTLSEEVEKKVSEQEFAIAAYEKALLVRTQTDFPIEWAAIQNDLGIAYWQRIRGDKAENIEMAIAAYEQSLLVSTQTDFPIKWATTQNNLGVAYNNRIRGDEAQNIESAIAAYEQALLVYTQTDFPIEWAKTQNNLGAAYTNRIRGDKAQNLEVAIAACQQALLVQTQTDFPMDWAMTQNNLGIAYRERIRGDKAQNIEAAIAAYEQALLVYTQTDFPMEWATIQNNLGIAYRERIRGDKAENIEIAIAAYEQSLLVYTQTDFPIKWATTQNILGAAYIKRIRGDKAQNLEAAIAAFQQALLVLTQTDFPIDWARTQHDLGNAYNNRIRGDKAQNTETAIAAYEQALLVLTQTDFPIKWAATQTGLGIAYSNRIRGDKAENIESAIAAYEQALLVLTQTDFLIKWAATQNILGDAYIKRIRGDKAQNLEAAIAAFQQALLVLTQTDFPMEWAATQYNLGIAYSDRIRGNKAENIETAIAAFQQALLVYTQTDFPMDWAMTQNNLGIAYSDRIRGDKAENIEMAIAAFEQALLVYTQTDFPMDWAKTQHNLGIAYNVRIRGDKAQNLEASIAAFQQALLVYTQTDFPMDWAKTQICLGNAYIKRIRGDKAQNLEASIAAFQKALLVYTQTDFPMDWGTTQICLGNAYIKRIRGDKAQNLEASIAAFQQALLVYTQTDFPMEWAATQNILGLTYIDRIRGDKAQNLEASIAAYEQALLVSTQTDFPFEWAMTQYNLGIAYSDRIRGNKAENIETAIASYEQALLVYTQTDFPMDWAKTQICLGNAYSNRIRGDKAQNLEAAIAADEQALLVSTQTDFPFEWAMTQYNLGIAYSDRIRGNKAENIETAIASYEQALLVYTQTDFPIDWAKTQNGLGLAYSNRIRGNNAQNIESAIAAYQQALQVRTQTDFPMDWAMTQHNLGSAYIKRIRGDKAQNLEAAIAAYQEALLVQTQTDFPMQWAGTQNNLGLAYSDRIRGDKAENIESAIAAYEQALLVRTQTDCPMDWAATQNNLGSDYIKRIRGDKAQNIESAIAAYQEALLVHTQTDFPMEWATTQNNLGIAYSHRIRGNKAQNIEAAIAAYEQALLVYTQTDFPMDWATTQNNLGVAYGERIRGDKAQNMESAIACYEAALRVRKPKSLPAECLQTAYNLANLAAKQQNYQLAIKNYELAIAAIEQSRDWTPDEMARQEILRNNIYVYQNMVQACVNTQQYDKALETVERFRCRRLLDLILTKDFYKDREVPEDIRNLEAQMEDKQREIDYLRQQLINQKNNQEKTGATRHISRDEWDDITEEIENLMTKKQEIWQQLRELDPVLSEGIQAPTVSVEKMKELLEIPQQPGEPFHVTASNSPSPQQKGEKQTNDVAILSFYTTDHETYIFILTQTGVKLHRCQEQGYKNFQLWLRDNWLKPYSQRNYLAEKHAAANLAKCDIDAIESIHSKASKVLVQLTDGTTTEIELAQFETTRKQQKHKLYKQWQNQMEETLKELADRLQINQLIEKLTDIKEIILVPFMYLHQIPLPILPLDNGQYLGEKFRVRIAPSTQVLTFCQKQPPNREKNLPPYGIVENTKDDLPYTPTECQLVAQIYGVAPQHHLKGSKEATKAKYKKLLTREKVLGLLSSHHATSNLTQPLESKLFLGDTDLTLGELLNATIRFPQVGDLFLSCCETALGNSELTDDIFTLSAAFLSAGASNVISSLWAVNDLATTILSYFFHRNRAAGIPSVDALWQGQMELKELTLAKAEENLDNAEAVLKEVVKGSIEYQEKEKIADNCQEVCNLVFEAKKAIGGEKPFDHPYYWAGFVCQG